jgi:hypothetical protein
MKIAHSSKEKFCLMGFYTIDFLIYMLTLDSFWMHLYYIFDNAEATVGF